MAPTHQPQEVVGGLRRLGRCSASSVARSRSTSCSTARGSSASRSASGVAVAATVGDLMESLIKRDLGIKDMSNVLPGPRRRHGPPRLPRRRRPDRVGRADAARRQAGLTVASPAFGQAGRVALVTGAGSPTGIGFATARLLGRLGARVVLAATTDRVHDRVAELPARRGHGDRPRRRPHRRGAGQGRSSSACVAEHGRLDVVVNNAGMTSAADPTRFGGDLAGTDPDALAPVARPQPRHRLPRQPGRPAAPARRRAPVGSSSSAA